MATEVKIGDQVELDKATWMVALPDGTVVTARGNYTVRHEGKHTAGDKTFVGVKPDEASGSEPEEEADEDEYDDMSYPELQAEAKSRGLNAGGSADDLRERLREDDE